MTIHGIPAYAIGSFGMGLQTPSLTQGSQQTGQTQQGNSPMASILTQIQSSAQKLETSGEDAPDAFANAIQQFSQQLNPALSAQTGSTSTSSTTTTANGDGGTSTTSSAATTATAATSPTQVVHGRHHHGGGGFGDLDQDQQSQSDAVMGPIAGQLNLNPTVNLTYGGSITSQDPQNSLVTGPMAGTLNSNPTVGFSPNSQPQDGLVTGPLTGITNPFAYTATVHSGSTDTQPSQNSLMVGPIAGTLNSNPTGGSLEAAISQLMQNRSSNSSLASFLNGQTGSSATAGISQMSQILNQSGTSGSQTANELAAVLSNSGTQSGSSQLASMIQSLGSGSNASGVFGAWAQGMNQNLLSSMMSFSV